MLHVTKAHFFEHVNPCNIFSLFKYEIYLQTANNDSDRSVYIYPSFGYEIRDIVKFGVMF